MSKYDPCLSKLLRGTRGLYNSREVEIIEVFSYPFLLCVQELAARDKTRPTDRVRHTIQVESFQCSKCPSASP